MSRIVLVADDNMTIQRMAAEMLAGQDLEVVTVANGVAAIKKLAAFKPAAILADVDMPGRDGYEVCDFVKKSAELREVPVILAFSDADPLDPERAAAVKADSVLKKPFHRPDLLARIEQFIGRPATSPQPGPGSESAPEGDDSEAAAPAFAPSQYTLSEEPAHAASFAGIPEGAGLFEPEAAAESFMSAGSESLPSFVPVVAREFPSQLPTPELAIPAASAEVSLPVFAPEASAEHACPIAEHEESGASSGIAAQEAPAQPNAAEMQCLPHSPAEAESAPEITSGKFGGDDRVSPGISFASVEDAASRLGDWKLQETPVDHRQGAVNEPVLAAVPDLTVALPDAAPVETVDDETADQPPIPQVNDAGTWVGTVGPNEVFSEVAYGQVDSVPVEEPPVERLGDHHPPNAPPNAGGWETQIGEALLPSDAVVPEVDASPGPAPEEELTSLSAAPSAAAADSEEELVPVQTNDTQPWEVPAVKTENGPSWDIPSEAALHEAFLEAALSSIGAPHATAPVDAATPLLETPAAPEDPQGPVEVLRAPESPEAPAQFEEQSTEPPAWPAAPSRSIDRNLVESIVQRVVIRMSPSALPPEMIEQMVKKLTVECLEDLESNPTADVVS